MNERPTILERAFALARSGAYPGVSAVKHQLRLEGFSTAQQEIVGPTLIRQLRRLCQAAYDPALP